jgi:hypothetical protein
VQQGDAVLNLIDLGFRYPGFTDAARALMVIRSAPDAPPRDVSEAVAAVRRILAPEPPGLVDQLLVELMKQVMLHIRNSDDFEEYQVSCREPWGQVLGRCYPCLIDPAVTFSTDHGRCRMCRPV